MTKSLMARKLDAAAKAREARAARVKARTAKQASVEASLAKLHAITRETYRIVREAETQREWELVAKRAGLSVRTVRAIREGNLLEMRLTNQLRLASALGIEVSFRVPKRSRDGAQRRPLA